MSWPAIFSQFGSLILVFPCWGWLIVAATIGLVYWEMRKF